MDNFFGHSASIQGCFLSLVLSLVICCPALFAQTYGDYQDVVYLKDGSIIRGIIVEEVPNESIKIKSGDNLFSYRFEQIEKLGKEPRRSGGGGIGDFGFRPRGFTASYELGLTYVFGGGGTPMFSGIMSHGYQFNPYVSLGLATGGEVSSKGLYNVPVYADMRLFAMKSRATPFFGLGAGYNLMISRSSSWYSSSSTVQHGFMVAPTLGVRVALSRKTGIGLGLGYRYIGNPVKSYYGSDVSVNSFHCLTFRGLFTF